jgi:two-component system cell cycle sensor histidine kinase/response regulator CckA
MRSEQENVCQELESTYATILVVEDEILIREIIEATLKRAGYRVLTAANGVEGSLVFAREFEVIDLLITDISMRGTELARFARKIRPNLPVIFASGSLLLEDPHPSEYIEGALFVDKPFTSEDLLCCVKAAALDRIES